ncbi:hypothetical protein GCM10020219_040490 [Nonomuraea dietziae]
MDGTREGRGAAPSKEHGCHKLRHAAASAWLAADVDIVTVAEYLGHSDPVFNAADPHTPHAQFDRARKAGPWTSPGVP